VHRERWQETNATAAWVFRRAQRKIETFFGRFSYQENTIVSCGEYLKCGFGEDSNPATGRWLRFWHQIRCSE